ncbi:CAAX protease, partial [Bacillus tropicus]|nr:CAAX protease [Bacillus tropicus]
WGRKAKQRDFS